MTFLLNFSYDLPRPQEVAEDNGLKYDSGLIKSDGFRYCALPWRLDLLLQKDGEVSFLTNLFMNPVICLDVRRTGIDSKDHFLTIFFK